MSQWKSKFFYWQETGLLKKDTYAYDEITDDSNCHNDAHEDRHKCTNTQRVMKFRQSPHYFPVSITTLIH